MPHTYYAIDKNAVKQKRQLAKTRREVVSSANAKVDPSLAAITLAVVKQGDNYLFNYVNILLKDKYINLTIEQNYVLLLQQFTESLRALWHNINFVLSVQNFELNDRKGNLIDMEYLKNLGFTYSTQIRSKYAHRSITSPIKSPEEVLPALILVLESSQAVVASFDDIIAEVKKNAPELYENLSDKIDLRTKLLSISINLITSLKNDRINLDKFKNEIYYGNRSQTLVTL